MINARDIAKIENKRKEIKKDTYLKIYEQFSRKIRQNVELGQKQVFLVVPTFVIGFPPFDVQKAADYLQRQLERAEFTVVRVSEHELHVTWSLKQKEKEKEQEKGEDFDGLPSLMNLRKAASKYRRG